MEGAILEDFSLKMQLILLLLPISSHGSTTATVSSWVHLNLSFNLSRFSWHPTTTTQHLSWKNCTCFPFQNILNIKSLVCVSMLWMVLTLLTFLNCSMSTLRLVAYALLLTLTCWKSSNTNARVMAFVLSLDPTFGIHSHKTLDTAQPCHLLKPNWKPPLLTVFSPQLMSPPSFCYSHCVPVCVCPRAHVCFHIIPYVKCFGRCSTCVQNIVFRLICIMWALRALLSAW